MKKKNKFVLLIMLLGLALIVIGSSYAYFQFRKDSDDNVITMGDLSLEFIDSSIFAYTLAFPTSYEEAITKTNNYKTFKVTGSNDTKSDVSYGIYLNHANSSIYGTENLKDNELAFELVKIVDGEEEVLLADYRSNSIVNKLIYIDTVEAGNTDYDVDYRLRVWVNDSVTISDTKNANYTTNQYASRALNLVVKVQTISNGSNLNSLYDLVSTGSVLDSISSTYVTSSSGIDLKNISSNTNGKGKYIFDSSKNDRYPIVYYRGDIYDNNVIFAGICWSIIRTTETGGVKMIYNGDPTNNTCTNHGSNNNTSNFNTLSNVVYGVGYMYNDYTSETSLDTTFYRSDEYKYNMSTNRYYLTGNDKDTANSYNRRYSVKSTNASSEGNSLFYNVTGLRWIELKNGETPEEALEKDFEPVNNSYTKTVVDSFFNRLKNYAGLIEDTVYCNDRTYSLKKNNNLTSNMVFGSYDKLYGTEKVDLKCPNVRDSFTVRKTKGNGNLTYPIGLMTVEEMMLAGAFSATEVNYANTYIGIDTLTMSPIYYDGSNAPYMTKIDTSGSALRDRASQRPVISLAYGVTATGTGTQNDPYIVN